MTQTLLVKNGTVLIDQEFKSCDVLLENGVIKTIEEHIEEESSWKIIDAQGLHILPGAIDSQVHFREPGPTHKEDLATGSLSALLGGITGFLEMPNTTPPTTTMDSLKVKGDLANGRCWTHYGFFMGAAGDNTEELKHWAELPFCVGIKIFLGSSTGPLLLNDPEKLLDVLNLPNVIIAVHSEDENRLRERIAIRDQATDAHQHPVWRDEETALNSTKMIIDLAKKAGRKVHVLHITSKEEIEFLKEHKDYCTVEITPQHLTLHAPDCYDRLGTYAQMNPPIRSLDHQEGLWRGIKEGVADIIGSDHAPHTREEKDKGYPHSPSGMPGVQTLLPIMLNHVNNGKLDLIHLSNLISRNVAKLYNLKKKGHIAPGMDGDLTIVDMNKEVTLQNEMMASKCGWTPFAGMTVKGFPVGTVIDGQLCMWQGEVLGQPIGRPIRA